jgi:predicted RecA/RadA family phage recombinase
VTLKAPDPGLSRAAVEFLTVIREDGPIVKYHGQTILFKDGSLTVEPGIRVKNPAIHLNEPLDIVFATRANDVAVYANGEFFTSFGTDAPTSLIFVRSDWSNTLQGLVTFDRPVSPGQIKRNAAAAADFVHGFASGPPGATVDLQLSDFTPVPDPVRIKPYRNALLAEEYRVVDIVDAGSTSLKVGDTVRVFQYGVLDGKTTAVKDLKTGARVRLKIELMTAAAPGVQHEYQLDNLSATSLDPYYVEVTES